MTSYIIGRGFVCYCSLLIGRRRIIFNHVIRFRSSTPRRLKSADTPAAASTFERPAGLIIGFLFAIALLAFELFNFDTTRFALSTLFGNERVFGVGWATMLAIAFCTIDFAGLLRLFLPDGRGQLSAEVWYLMGAWLLGATLNAIMTWWAVSLALLDQPLGNEIMDREMLLTTVPIFVACLVWLTRILFIGSLSVAGSYFLAASPEGLRKTRPPQRPVRSQQRPLSPPASSKSFQPTTDELPPFLADMSRAPMPSVSHPVTRKRSRTKKRPVNLPTS